MNRPAPSSPSRLCGLCGLCFPSWPKPFALAFFALVWFAGPARAADRQTIHGAVPSVVSRLQPVDRLPATQRLWLAIGLPPRNEDGLNQLLQQLYDPADPNYQHWLTPAQFTESFGPSEQDYAAVMEWANSNGLPVTVTHPNRIVVDVEGSVADIEKALNITLRVFNHPTESRTFYAPDAEPSAALTVPIRSIAGLDNFSLPHPMSHPQPVSGAGSIAPKTGSGPSGLYRGADFRAAYVPGTPLRGEGQSIGLLQFSSYFANDIATYASGAGLTNVPQTVVAIDGTANSSGNGETALDIEMVISMAPGLSQVYVYEAPNPSPWVDLLSRMANDNLSRQLSCSWGGGSPDASSETIFKQMAAQGQSFFNATGDSDAFTGSIPFPSDSTNITQVGGTTLTTTNAGAYVSEKVWNWGRQPSGYVGSGGGVSTYYQIPSYQTGISMSQNLGSTTMRNVPDVALTADNVYEVYNNGSGASVGGTSCAAPLWAAFTALINQQAAANGRTNVGFINPAVYALGKGATYTSVFHDITTGNNTWRSSPTKYYAVTGYDLCTGWGTPNGTNLINALAPLAVSSSPPTITAQPLANQTVELSSNASFSVTASGTAPLAYQWYFGAGALAGRTSASLTISNVGFAQAGTYSIRITNSYGSVTSSPANLNVVDTNSPTITAQPLANQTVELSSNASFSVTASGAAPLAYQWYFGAGALAGKTSAALTISNVAFAQAGTYSVRITNSYGGVTSSPANVSVVDTTPPTISSCAPNANVSADSTCHGTVPNLTSQVVASDASGPVTVTQSPAAGTLVGLGSTNITFTVRDSSSNASTCIASLLVSDTTPPAVLFSVANVTLVPTSNCQAVLPNLTSTNFFNASDTCSSVNVTQAPLAGTLLSFGTNIVTITARDTAGNVTNRAVPVIVSGAPNITAQPASASSVVGGNATFNVGACGASALVYAWRHAGTNLPGTTSATLTLTNLHTKDAGAYLAVASNASGSATSAVATLTVPLATPTVTWTNPATITYGVALGSNQLDASASVSGSFVYHPAAGTVLGAGTNLLSAIFTPDDAADYKSASNSVALVVLRAPLSVVASNASRAYGVTNPPFTGALLGLQNGDSITAAFACAATATNLPGDYPILSSLIDPGNEQTNYQVTLVNGTLTVTNVPPPVFQEVTRSGNSLLLTWSAVPGRSYQLQFLTNLPSTDWTTLPAEMATNPVITVSGPLGPEPQRFYRVVLLP
jgi:hypothetical protein